jgi:class 3 adenylate cyclase
MEPQPEVRYARSAGAQIAYQVFGDGAVDLVYLPPWGNIVWNWEWPPYAHFLRRLAAFSRLIVVDRRGFGCSSGAPPARSLEEDVDDLVAVVEDAQGPAPVIFSADGGFSAILAAATHPERVAGLVVYVGERLPPAGVRTEELPWLSTLDQVSSAIGQFARVSNPRDRVQQYIRTLDPSFIGDHDYFEWALRMFPLNCTPETWVAYRTRLRDTNVAPLLESIRQPTLVLARPDGPRGEQGVLAARYVAERIPGARLVELPGVDANPWAGDPDAVADAIAEFLLGAPGSREPTRALATLMFTDIVDSTRIAAELGDARWRELVEAHHARARAAFAAHRGREVDAAGDGFLVLFDGPARAVACAVELSRAVAELGIHIRAGCHTGEVERTPEGVRGIAVHIGARVAALAEPGEVLVSRTVRDLTAGSGLEFEDAGEHELKGVPELWQLYRVRGE